MVFQLDDAVLFAKDKPMEFIDPSEIRPGPIKHAGLDPEWEGIARHTYQVVGHLVKPTYEQWELDFLRDQNPQQELFLWLVIADAFEMAVTERPDLDEKTILGDLILVSAGGESQHGLDGVYETAGRKYQPGEG